MADAEKITICASLAPVPAATWPAYVRLSLASRWFASREEPRLGGVCLNVGCIPSKALLDSSEVLPHGENPPGRSWDPDRRAASSICATMMARKDQVVRELCDNVRKLLEGNKIG